MIDEKKLVDELNEWSNLDKEMNELVLLGIDTFKRMINKQPKVDKWIPCSEKLPEKDGDYLVWYFVDENRQGYEVSNFDTDMGENGEFGYWQDYYDNQTLGFLDSEWIEFETVVAWQPLPEKYEVKENENK